MRLLFWSTNSIYPYLILGSGNSTPAVPVSDIEWVGGSAASGDAVYGGGRTSLTVSTIAGIQNEDALILEVLTASNGADAPDPTPTDEGFELIASVTASDGNPFTVEKRIYLKFANGESGGYTVTHATASSQAYLTVLRGVDPATPLDIAPATATGTGATRTFPAVATVTDKALLYCSGFDFGDASADLSPPSGMDERFDGAICYTATETRATAGPTGTRAHTCNSTSSPWGAVTIAFRAKGAVPSGAGLMLYVATDGDNSNDGSAESPLATITAALALVGDGDTVVVRPGTYAEGGLVVPTGATLKSETSRAALIRPPAYIYGIIYPGSFSTVEGFDVGSDYAHTHGIFGNGVHHVTIRDCAAHGGALGGISFMRSDFLTLDGCTTYSNPLTDWGSGVSIYNPEEFPLAPGEVEPEFRIVIRDLISYDNVQSAGIRSDGNGLIIDDFQHWQNPYYRVGFTGGTEAFTNEGTVVINGVNATVKRVDLTSGAWADGDAAGTLWLAFGGVGAPDPDNVATGTAILVSGVQRALTQGDYTYYSYERGALVENCLFYDNGGKGVAIHWADNCTVRNVTAVNNNNDLGNTTTWRGELSQQDCRDVTWERCIGVTTPATNAANSGIGYYGAVFTGSTWTETCSFNGTPGDNSVNLGSSTSDLPSSSATPPGSSNFLGVDPQLDEDYIPQNPALEGIGYRPI